ncbi:MAG: hypothetical protein A2418_01080 [Candidatus Brennerbacteria bacterium RIFOXYC1_FULL_41_11]|uniref:Helix-turn-helix domain-containing protein n=1 Tax=Candidatus Brennerbacteria bacterium RIFOXYD1_FULL_41_16 TaxID=1797529 RepID=A0A1G1XLT0_9BACT|nr:MAG: hypothetical protein UU61_C0025G0005 [Parcubacteria group bacterium GW2011_GWB1_41_4]OGY39402.1 MAG: hypothetical protein A2391_02950 [Candidatus Brennerbacteria bacterium RIFOXYB1_FULL_41_13]OGY40036.1 MAG: hypothetical protein A2418_01080 [Candidatus Brennerbacteria bacterium RIFOXYC1_FULL_41_11]OGY40968.1 MAG: hypothetical protein A2570_00550 [Candidatus Brennerbacteria bacterium RIFOXYD1_FULL_41_16]
MKKEFFTTTQLAKILGISRIAVFKRIKAGKIDAIKDGRDFLIPINSIKEISGHDLKSEEKELIEKSVERIVKQYGEALRLLGEE